jgi:hypothetical protein
VARLEPGMAVSSSSRGLILCMKNVPDRVRGKAAVGFAFLLRLLNSEA